MTDAPLNRRPNTTAAIAVSLLAIAAISGIDLGRDLHRQSTARQVQFQKSQLALLSQLELGRAVQDFKDCLLRAASPYCDDFYDHIQAVDRDVSLYRAQSADAPTSSRRSQNLGRPWWATSPLSMRCGTCSDGTPPSRK